MAKIFLRTVDYLQIHARFRQGWEIDRMTVSRACPVCNAGQDKAELFLRQNIDESRIVGSSFASRKVPEYMNHGMVRCTACDLVYVDHPPSQDELAESYHAADYDSAEEAEHAADAYINAIAPVLEKLKGRCDSALEIGTGTAAFLERLKEVGFSELVGIEPSIAAIEAAPTNRKNWIREGIFEADMYPPESFDLIACFMTLEHVQDPGALVAAAHKMLRPGGVFVAVTHDYRGWVNRLLGKRSPIIDIEHMQLFSAHSSKQLLALRGYDGIQARQFRNAYRPSYWIQLVPIPGGIKSAAIKVISMLPINRVRIPFNVGNTVSWGFR
jgi:SAM-dependent methyltransferase